MFGSHKRSASCFSNHHGYTLHVEWLLNSRYHKSSSPHLRFPVTCSNRTQFATSPGKWKCIFNYLHSFSYRDILNMCSYADICILPRHSLCLLKYGEFKTTGLMDQQDLLSCLKTGKQSHNCTRNPLLTDTHGRPKAWICSTTQGAFRWTNANANVHRAHAAPLKPVHTSVSEIRAHFPEFLRSCHLRFLDKGWAVLAWE